ncbi:unnamed protein product [Strongylus vulgaris]|uniref:Uncharacterized protein n=1 Tax=Strongylus vulgaris TaxID=40348 RepID=A0A3P7J5Z8_STRVU|nr:unnamed protein product [Strongylus vulgaris]
MADQGSPNGSTGAPGSPNPYDVDSPGYEPTSSPRRSADGSPGNGSAVGTPSHVSAPSSPLSAHADE